MAEEVQSHLSIRCPHCHHVTQAVDETILSEMVCVACQQKFSLIEEDADSRPRVFGHFELIEQLGSGSFGTVWKARDFELGRDVAVKIPHKTRLTPAEATEFLRDARAAAQLRHPHIVNVFEVGQYEQSVYIVSDYIAGPSLARLLQEKGPWSARDAARLGVKLARALDHAHVNGVIHRDIKPQNVMLDASGEPFLIDFGLAKREQGEVTMTMEGRILGTPAYMSPEQARGEAGAADRRADVYSLGVVLYELLTGERPFRGNLQMMLQQLLHDEPLPPRRLVGTIPRDLETIVLKCIQKSPERRYATAREVADDLERFLRGESIRARPVGPILQAWRWYRRNPVAGNLLVAVGVLLAVLAAGALAAAAVFRNESRRLELTAERLRRQTYYRTIAVAEREWLEHDPEQAEQLLNDSPADLRGWEWRYLRHQLHGAEIILHGDGSPLAAVAVRPDGRQAAAAGDGMAIDVWDLPEGRLLRSLEAHQFPVAALCYAPDGTHLISCGLDRQVVLWNAESGALVRQWRLPLPPVDAAFIDGGARIAVLTRDADASSQTVHLLSADAAFPDQQLPAHPAGQALSFGAAAAGTPRLLVGTGTGARLWTLPELRPGNDPPELPSPGQTLDDAQGAIAALALRADGARAAAVVGRSVRIWDLAAGTEVETHRVVTLPPACVEFSPDGSWLAAAADDGLVHVWSLNESAGDLVLRGHRGPVKAIAFAGNDRLATASRDGTVRLWNLAFGHEPRRQAPHGGLARAAAVVPGSARIATAGNDGSLRIWDPRDGARVARLTGHEGPVLALDASRDGQFLASGGRDGTVRVWSTADFRERSVGRGHLNDVTAVAFRPDGSRVASVSTDGTLRTWDPSTGNQVSQLAVHDREVTGLAWDPSGTSVATVARDRRLRTWSVDAGGTLSPAPRLDIPHDDLLFCVGWSRNGRWIAAAGRDRRVYVYQADSGGLVQKLRGHVDVVSCLAFTPDGGRLVTGSWDQTIRLWELETGTELLALRGHRAPVRAVAFSAEGDFLASVDAGEQLRLWRAPAAND